MSSDMPCLVSSREWRVRLAERAREVVGMSIWTRLVRRVDEGARELRCSARHVSADHLSPPRDNQMRKLIVSEFMTLDGVIQAPGGKDEDRDGGFEHGGWTWPYWHDDIGAAFGSLMQDTDAFLLGRRTYVTHADAFEPLPAEN